jgi:hypothetical protein
MDRARNNIFASFDNLRDDYRRLSRIDRLYQDLIGYLYNTPEWFAGFFLLRAHSAFLASCRLSLSGQVAESYVVQRSCIEAGLYGLYMSRNRAKAAIWLDRHQNEESRSRCREEFKTRKLLACLRAESSQLGARISELYEHTIDFGAHPNERALMTNLNLAEGEEIVQFELQYLKVDNDWFPLCLRTTAKVGVRVLEIFERIYRNRMALTGLADRLDELKRDLP